MSFLWDMFTTWVHSHDLLLGWHISELPMGAHAQMVSGDALNLTHVVV